MKNLKLLVDRIEQLEDENHRLMIERDTLKNQINTIRAQTMEELLRQDIFQLEHEHAMYQAEEESYGV